MANKKLRDFTPWQQWWMKLHIKMCAVCGEYQKDAEKFQETESGFADKEKFEEKLDDKAKSRLRQKIKECCSKDCS